MKPIYLRWKNDNNNLVAFLRNIDILYNKKSGLFTLRDSINLEIIAENLDYFDFAHYFHFGKGSLL
jgi:hypothetical protein